MNKKNLEYCCPCPRYVKNSYFTLHILWVSGKGTESYHATQDGADIMASKVLATRSRFGSVSTIFIKEVAGTMPDINPHGI